MSAAVSAPATVVAAASTGAISTTATTAIAVSTAIATGAWSASKVTVSAISGTAVSTAISVTGPPVVASPTIITSATKAAVIPRPRAEENASGEPAWPIVTIGRARVRVISVITVGADWSRANVLRANSEADHDSLRVGVRCHEKAEAEQRKNF